MVAMIAAAEGAVMLVVLVLLLAEEGIGGVGDEAAAVVGAVMLVALVLFSSKASVWLSMAAAGAVVVVSWCSPRRMHWLS